MTRKAFYLNFRKKSEIIVVFINVVANAFSFTHYCGGCSDSGCRSIPKFLNFWHVSHI